MFKPTPEQIKWFTDYIHGVELVDGPDAVSDMSLSCDRRSRAAQLHRAALLCRRGRFTTINIKTK